MKNFTKSIQTLLFLGTLSIGFLNPVFAQDGNVGIGLQNPDASAILHIDSNDKGLLVPRTNSNANNWTPISTGNPDGLLRYDTYTRRLQSWNAGTSSWTSMGLWTLDAATNNISYNSGNVEITGADNDGTQAALEVVGQFGGTMFIDGNEIDCSEKLNINTNTNQNVVFGGGNVGIDIGGNTIIPVIDLAIGDNDTGFQQQGDGELGIFTNNTEKVRIGSDGRVEIFSNNNATSSPGTGVLEIGGTLRIDNNSIVTNTNTTLFLNPSNNSDLNVDLGTLVVDASANRVGVNVLSPLADLHIKQGSPVDSDVNGIRLERNNSTNHWNTYVWSDNDYAFVYNNTLKSYIKDTDGSYNISSDRRLKKNIIPFSNVLPQLLQLNPVSYHFKDTPDDNPKSYGFIAQEVQLLFPEVVGEKAGFLSLKYGELGIVAIKAIQEQNQIIQDQQKEIDELKARLNKIEAMLKK